MQRVVDDLSVALSVLELLQDQHSVPDELREMADTARARLEALGERYLRLLAAAPAA